MITSKIVQRKGLRIHTPPDGRERVALSQERGRDLILLDLEMPSMDAIGADPRTHDAPFDSYTSREEGTQEQAVEDGITVVVSKAASNEDLLAALQAYLSAVETVSRHQEPLRIG